MTIRVGIASGDWVHPRKTGLPDPVWGGSGWARLGQYADKLPFEVSVGTLTWYKDRFVIITVEETIHEVDVIYMQRLMHEGLKVHVPLSIANGQKIINDLDDWYWGLDTSNMAFSANHPKLNKIENTNNYRAILSKSSIITVSTQYLADRISSFVKCPIVVTENTVDINRFTEVEHTDTSIPCVGWVGSTAHRSKDIETLKGVLDPMVKNGTISLYHGGHHNGAPSFASKLGLPEDMVSVQSMKPAELYPQLMQMDIGIVPLNKTPFNMAKSDIKGLEYAASGIPFVAQDLNAYVSLNKTLNVGFVAEKPKDWIKYIKQLSDPVLRKNVAVELRSRIQSRDISHGIVRLTDLISNI